MRGVREIYRAFRWLRGRLVRGGLILLYHRVAVSEVDPHALCVTPDHFRAQMAVLRAWGHPMTLSDLLASVHGRALPRRAIAVTFDDGYADTLYSALPVLTEYDIPATVFVSTGNPGQPFWWDRVNYQILDAPTLPSCLELRIGAQTHRWTVDSTSRRQRYALLSELNALCRRLSVEARSTLVRQVEEWAGRELLGDIRALTPSELRELASSELIDVGAHTVHHPALPALTPQEQLHELQQSRVDLEALVGHAVTGMSYPFGLRGRDYTRQTTQLARQAGYEWACAVYRDVVRAGTDILQLPRYWVNNWSDKQFIRQLKRWLR